MRASLRLAILLPVSLAAAVPAAHAQRAAGAALALANRAVDLDSETVVRWRDDPPWQCPGARESATAPRRVSGVQHTLWSES